MIITVLKIDSLRKTVEAVEMSNDLSGIYAAIEQDFVERVPAPFQSPSKDSLMVDGESLIRRYPAGHVLRGFLWQGFPNQILYGQGIVVGVRPNGNWTSCSTSAEELRRMIMFPDQPTLDHNFQLLTGSNPI